MAYTRARNIFDPASTQPFRLSRSKIENFLKCPRCFYLDRRLGVKQLDMFPYTLNNAVDHLMKKEFDIHRAKSEPHPLMKKYCIDAVPFQHAQLDIWRENFKGVQYLHEPTNFVVTGAVDDVWVQPDGQLIVVDYKATSTDNEISMDDPYRASYPRQMAVYQWLLRRNGFRVTDIGYFVYVNGKKDRAAFDGKLEFDVQILPYTCDDSWVEQTLFDAKACLTQDALPDAQEACDYCAYRAAAKDAEKPKQTTLFAVETTPVKKRGRARMR